jgi:hypothetical protein
MKKREKTGGRTKGTPNRTTHETKKIIRAIVDEELANIPIMLSKLEPYERINAITKLLPYVVPRQSEVKGVQTSNEIQPIIISFKD